MKIRPFFVMILLLLNFTSPAHAEERVETPIAWKSWTHEIFDEAKAENKFVILDLKAVWCHWCHVMDEITYKDPKVIEILKSKYIAVKVDQDANPDLSNRYEEYGWPATIIFGPDGQELAKRRGYIAPDVMISLLEAIIDDPTPGPSVRGELEVTPSKNAFLTPEQKEALIKEHFDLYDKENGGWGKVLKLIDLDQMEYALFKSYAGDKEAADMARTTLDRALNLLDPEWGGFYQYSDEVNWKSAHFEKIMWVQAGYIRTYALAYLIFEDKKYLDAANATSKFLKDFWTGKDGAFYTSQDADVSPLVPGKAYYPLNEADRRRLGMPRIDQNIYSRENGQAIEALASLYNATADDEVLARALTAARWILANRRNEDGSFKHGDQDRGGPFLGDSLYMARAFLALYASTSDRAWLKEAEKTAQAINQNFRDDKGGGYATSKVSIANTGVLLKPVKQFDENVALARFMNLLSYYSGKTQYREMAAHAVKYLVSPDLLKVRRFSMGVLLADRELASEPDHVTIVGEKKDPVAKDLYLTGLAYPSSYKRIEWWDRRAGPLPNPDVQYPELPKTAAFVCAEKVCSLPAFTREKLVKQIENNRTRKKA